MDVAVSVLESYRGKDKVIRTATYAALLVAGVAQDSGNKPLSQSLQTAVGSFSACRTVLRLFDDLSMLAHTLGYGLGKQERDPVVRWLSVTKNLFDQSFFPLEHIAWLGDKKIMQMKSTSKWMQASIIVWTISLTLGIIISLRQLMKLKRREKALMRDLTGARLREDSGETIDALEESLQSVRASIRKTWLDLIRNAGDFGNAVNWCPEGFLWSGKFGLKSVGFCGSVASVIGLYNIVNAHRDRVRKKTV
ncbi:peroxisomal membrane protein 11C-like [Ptychodera flava]|uniref:peroxisomal membrane protein 11C-like n=1 Tax=Ptychodera flava TaxID=63121 RepID=UPI003969D75C